MVYSHPIPPLTSHSVLAYLDDIADLKNPDLFYSKIVVELVARSSRGAEDSQQSVRNPSRVASIVSTRYRF